MVDDSLKTHPRDTDRQAKLILILHAHLLSFMCFLISSFATQMCSHNGYANTMCAFPTAAPGGTKQAAVALGTDVPNSHATTFEDKTGGRGEHGGGVQEWDMWPSFPEGNSFATTVCCRC